MKGQLFYTLLVLCMAHVVRTDIFSSFVNLQQSVYVEKELSQELRKFTKEQHTRLDELERIADKLEKHNTYAMKDKENHLSNPVNIYIHVKTLSKEWEKAATIIKNNASDDFLFTINSKLGQYLPSQEDVKGVAKALFRLQDTYKLTTEMIAKGDLQGIKESPHLTAKDCYDLGKLAYESGDHHHSINWMSEAIKVLDTETNKTADKATIMDYLSFSVYMQGNFEHALNITKAWLEIDPNHERAKSNIIYYERMLLDARDVAKQKGETVPEPVFKNERIRQNYRAEDSFLTYEALCRGEKPIPNPNAHKLKCRYVTKNNPMFFLSPLKEETLFAQPWIAFYHDVIRDADIEQIKQMAIPKLHRSGIFQYKGSANKKIQDYRTSKSAWIEYYEHPRLQILERRIAAMTAMSMETAEALQVLNYGIGGHYEPHYDYARKYESTTFELWQGNRIMTVILYLNNVTAGGATVFSKIGATVWPEKGGAVMWWNLHRNGEGDSDTLHAGCPVLTGTKWVCNKWIHDRGQELIPTRRCTLNPEE